MSTGTVLAANADVSNSNYAWVLGFLSRELKVLYLAFFQRWGGETEVKSFGTLSHHPILSPTCISFIAIAVCEIPAVVVFPAHVLRKTSCPIVGVSPPSAPEGPISPSYHQLWVPSPGTGTRYDRHHTGHHRP